MPRDAFSSPRIVFYDLLSITVEMTLKQTSPLSSNFCILTIAITLSKKPHLARAKMNLLICSNWYW